MGGYWYTFSIKLFLEAGEVYTNVGYHSLKLIADFNPDQRKYISFIFDGVAHDISGYACHVLDSAEENNALEIYGTYYDNSANENYISVDDLILTDQEP